MIETELITLLKQKDRTAFKSIVETWQDMVYNTALGILQNAEDAEDVTQEVFISVFESVASFQNQWTTSGEKKEKNDSLLYRAFMGKMTSL